MPDPDDLLNKGIIVNTPDDDTGGLTGRTMIVTGLQRSGTSLVAAILQQAGIFMGSQINDSVYEDEEIAAVLMTGKTAALKRIIRQRNTGYGTWGFKLPLLDKYLPQQQLALFNHPRMIITFRDPVAVSVRIALSEFQPPLRALRDSIGDLNAILAYVESLSCATLLLSYEKALVYPGEFVDAIMRFCGMPQNPTLRERLIATIEPNRTNYIAVARRRHEGHIEGVRDGMLCGWCRLTASPEPVTLELLVDDKLRLTFAADMFRQDLRDAGIGAGNHAFSIPLDAFDVRDASVIRIKAAGYDVDLQNSGRALAEYRRTA